jgi:hypothetical protein
MSQPNTKTSNDLYRGYHRPPLRQTIELTFTHLDGETISQALLEQAKKHNCSLDYLSTFTAFVLNISEIPDKDRKEIQEVINKLNIDCKVCIPTSNEEESE